MTRRLLGALVLAALLLAPFPVLAHTASSQPSADDAVLAADAVAFRTTAGLAADAATVADSLGNPSVYSNTRFGVPLTRAEAEVVLGQIAAQNELLPMAEAATELQDFASTYFTGGTLHVNVTGDPASAAVELGSVRPASADVVFERARVDHQRLAAVQDAIVGDRDLAALGVMPTTVAIDPVTTRVEVTFQAHDPIDTAAAILREKYGELVVVLVGQGPISLLACNSVDDCGTKGGLGGHHNSPAITCTTGFVAYHLTFKLILTAGHCIEQAGGVSNGYKWKNYLATVTWGYNSSYQYDALSDLGTFYIPSISYYNQYFAGGPADIRTIRTSERPESQMPVGLYECRSGHSSNWDCGTIHRANISATYDGFIHYGLWEVTPGSSYGDSGSGYVALERDDSYVIPLGILASGVVGGSYTYFVPAIDANSIFGAYVCTSSAC